VDQLLADYGNDSDVSLAILNGIEDAVKGASGQDKLDLQSAALEAAVNAVGLGNTVLNKFDDILDTVDSGGDVLGLVENVIDSLDNLNVASSALLGTLPDPDSDPTAFSDFVSNSKPDKLALAAAVLLASEAEKKGGAEGYINAFDPVAPATPNEAMAVAIAGQIASSYVSTGNDTDEIIQNMLKELKLIP
jgi:hypothetical protein